MRTFKCAFSLGIVWHTQTTVTPNCSCNSFVRSSNCEPTVRAERIEGSLISFVPNWRRTMSGEKMSDYLQIIVYDFGHSSSPYSMLALVHRGGDVKILP